MLKHLFVEACPYCGCTKVKERTQKNQHSNGQWNESIEFGCGYKVRYSPNFRKELLDEFTECSRSEAYKEKRKKRVAFREKLEKYIEKADIDEKFKERIKRAIEYI